MRLLRAFAARGFCLGGTFHGIFRVKMKDDDDDDDDADDDDVDDDVDFSF
jgi:hypothetical protein